MRYWLIELIYRTPRGSALEQLHAVLIVQARNVDDAKDVAKLHFVQLHNFHERYIKRIKATMVVLPTHDDAIELWNEGT